MGIRLYIIHPETIDGEKYRDIDRGNINCNYMQLPRYAIVAICGCGDM